MHADGDGQTCFPSYQTIAEEIGGSRSIVIRMIATLCRLKLLSSTTWASSRLGSWYSSTMIYARRNGVYAPSCMYPCLPDGGQMLRVESQEFLLHRVVVGP